MTQRDRVNALVQLSGLKFQADQAHLAQLITKERALRQNLQDLVGQRAARSASLAGAHDPATRAGADVQWQKWVDQRRKAINAELAQILAQKMEFQKKLRRSFGQDQAAQGLAAHVDAVLRKSKNYES